MTAEDDSKKKGTPDSTKGMTAENPKTMRTAKRGTPTKAESGEVLETGTFYRECLGKCLLGGF